MSDIKISLSIDRRETEKNIENVLKKIKIDPIAVSLNIDTTQAQKALEKLSSSITLVSGYIAGINLNPIIIELNQVQKSAADAFGSLNVGIESSIQNISKLPTYVGEKCAPLLQAA